MEVLLSVLELFSWVFDLNMLKLGGIVQTIHNGLVPTTAIVWIYLEFPADYLKMS